MVEYKKQFITKWNQRNMENFLIFQNILLNSKNLQPYIFSSKWFNVLIIYINPEQHIKTSNQKIFQLTKISNQNFAILVFLYSLIIHKSNFFMLNLQDLLNIILRKQTNIQIVNIILSKWMYFNQDVYCL
ncbi:hypothetical protein IMG5_063210 [Ichthyophthirius multifiliis]|uniref:Uncharacterized protein n=1 Tax=Ichthyophthirius multifiliis TaxID=5932 RepID=G0QP20_ICHMU|nr:hypothetical protein IMG5_063210 [Ichthyophthirius multifiliis]EGR33035.1 hypothetical protein IMG5_063210 [Ichthyophthirius multifiliis]|eukprot:XP_004037021.1 hypothetical protein IMG5_063210 [Ichthyophthirius multifiliis]